MLDFFKSDSDLQPKHIEPSIDTLKTVNRIAMQNRIGSFEKSFFAGSHIYLLSSSENDEKQIENYMGKLQSIDKQEDSWLVSCIKPPSPVPVYFLMRIKDDCLDEVIYGPRVCFEGDTVALVVTQIIICED